jgi:hypothetical protein
MARFQFLCVTDGAVKTILHELYRVGRVLIGAADTVGVLLTELLELFLLGRTVQIWSRGRGWGRRGRTRRLLLRGKRYRTRDLLLTDG